MDKNSEAWRLDCEIRHIASMTREQRLDWFKGMEKHRGREATQILVDQVNAYRRASSAATSSTSGLSADTAARIATAKGLIDAKSPSR